MLKLWLLIPAVFTLAMAVSAPALACPNCKEAVAASDDEDLADDPFREARAWNNSIYVMLAVPYTMLGVVGFYGYRTLKARGSI